MTTDELLAQLPEIFDTARTLAFVVAWGVGVLVAFEAP